MSTQLTGTGPVVVGQSLFTSVATAIHSLGEVIFTNDGRSFRYAKAGATALVAGTLQQAKAETTAHQNLVAAAAAIGATEIVTSAITVTENQYAGGYLLVSITPGEGYQYKIKGHAAATSAAVTLTLEDAIVVALTTASNYDLVTNPYSAVVINPTTATSAPVGVAVHTIAASEFGWLQTGGVANILNDAGSVVGTNVSASNATAGAVEASVTAQAAIGIAVTGVATTDFGAVKLFGL